MWYCAACTAQWQWATPSLSRLCIGAYDSLELVSPSLTVSSPSSEQCCGRSNATTAEVACRHSTTVTATATIVRSLFVAVASGDDSLVHTTDQLCVRSTPMQSPTAAPPQADQFERFKELAEQRKFLDTCAQRYASAYVRYRYKSAAQHTAPAVAPSSRWDSAHSLAVLSCLPRRGGYKRNSVETALTRRCLMDSLADASALSVIWYWFMRRKISNKRVAVLLSVGPVWAMWAAGRYLNPTCDLQLARQLDSPLGADVRTVLRGKFAGNALTAAIDEKDRDRPEKDEQSGTGLPLLWDLPFRTDNMLPKTSSHRQQQLEQQSLERESEADVMVMTEDEASASRGGVTPLQLSTSDPAASTMTPAAPSLRSPPSSTSAPSSAPSSASASHPSSGLPPPPRPRPQPSAAHGDSQDSPFADPSSRQPTAAEAADNERQRRRDEREKVRKQHEDDRRERMAQRSREDIRMTGSAAAVTGASDAKRRFVRRNEFGDEVYEDDRM